MRRAVIGMAVLWLTLWASGLVGVVGAARGHETGTGWVYPASCCSNQDCALVPRRYVRITAEGYEFALPPGLHPIAVDGGVFVVPQANLRPAPDGEYHLCVSPYTGDVLCAFGPGLGS